MNMPTTTRKKKGHHPKHEDVFGTKALIFRLTTLRLAEKEWSNLDADEATELVALTKKIDGDDGQTNLDHLSATELRRWESLIEAAMEVSGYFQRRREQADTEATLTEMERKSRLAKREGWQPPTGSVVLLAGDLMTYLDRPDPLLEVVDMGLLILIAAQIANGKALSPGARIEGHGDSAALVLDRGVGIGGKFDPDGRLPNLQPTVDHLSNNSWLVAERVGNETHLRLGNRLLRAVKEGS